MKKVIICYYYPPGNIATDINRPYPSGTPCSSCVTSAPDRDECDGRTSGLCSGCQALWYNWCDDFLTNCDDLTCPSSSTCQSSITTWPCNSCRRSCGACGDDKLTPSPTCSDSDQGFPAGITFPSDSKGSAYTVDDEEEENDNSNDDIDGTHIGLISWNCVLLVILIIGYIFHTRKIKRLQTTLSSQNHKEVIEFVETKSMDLPTTNGADNNDDNDPEIEFSFDMKGGSNNTQEIVAEDSE